MKEKIIKYGKFAVLGIILLITLIFVYNTTKKEQEQITTVEPLIEEQLDNKEPKEEIQETKKIKVDIKGEVINPGVYELNEEDRVSDAINKSGGLTQQADTTLINLSKNLKDEMVIVIYNKNEIEKLKKDLTTTKTVIEYIEKECSCPDTINDACITEPKEEIKTPTEVEEITPDTNKTLETKNSKISINKGTLEELQTLPGIGESKAKAIIEYREKNGEFKDIKDITNVSGIGESTLEKFKNYITI